MINVRLTEHNSRRSYAFTIVIHNAYHTLYPALHLKGWPRRNSIVSHEARLGKIRVYLGLEWCDVELEKVDGNVVFGVFVRAI